MEDIPSKEQLVEFLKSKNKKSDEVPSKFEYEDRLSYIKALLNWEVNRGVFYRKTKQQAEDLKESLSVSINPQNITIYPVNTRGEQLYKVTTKKPKIEGKTEQQSRVIETKNTEIQSW